MSESLGKEDVQEGSGSGSGLALGSLDILLLVGFVVVVVLVVYSRLKKKSGTPSVARSLSIDLGQSVAPSSDLTEQLNFFDRMKATGKKVIVFYGSQTGTAEEFALRLAKDARRYGMPAMSFDPEECTDWEELLKLKDIEGSLAIFCLATYGEGDPTDNAIDLYEWLKDGGHDLTGLRYTVFGLGNKTYEHYNAMGREVDKFLEKNGAERIFERGEGDDDANIEEDFVTWKEKLWPAVCEYFGLDTTEGSIGRDFELTVHEDLPPEKVFVGEPHKLGSYEIQKPPFNQKNPYLAPVGVNRELHKGGDRSCMHIEFDITGSKLKYTAGDHVAVLAENDPTLVEKIGKLLNIDLETVFSLTNNDEMASKKHPFPCPTTYRTALMHYVDIASPPRTHVLKEIIEYAQDEKEKEFLKSLTAPTEEAKKLYGDWIVKDHRDITAVLEDLPSVKPPLDLLLELLPRLQCRYYSISSSSKMYPNSVHITAVLVEYQTNTGRTTKGVATSWLKTKVPNGDVKPHVPIFVRKSTLRLPFRPVCPVIMVGPGTGLAPFRGFIQERSVAKKEGKMIGDTVLYFGCRHKSQDYIYEEELAGYEEEGTVSDLQVAFSRDQAHKVYVTHKMEENKEQIWKIINDGGYLYVCGDARNMARDVHSILFKILKEQGGLSEEEATSYIKKMQTRSRYQQDVWS